MLSVGAPRSKNIAILHHAISSIDRFGFSATDVLHRPMHFRRNLQRNVLNCIAPFEHPIVGINAQLARFRHKLWEESPLPSSPEADALTVKSNDFWSGVIFVIVTVQASAA